MGLHDQRMYSFYSVDKDFTLIDIGGDWDQFAIENNGATCLAANLIGSELLQFISGDSTKMWINAIIQRARYTGDTIVTRYRCDGPDTKRVFRLTARLNSADLVRVEHQLLSTEKKPAPPPVITKAGKSNRVQHCCDCSQVEIDGQWQDIEDRELDTSYFVIHTVCESCRKKP